MHTITVFGDSGAFPQLTSWPFRPAIFAEWCRPANILDVFQAFDDSAKEPAVLAFLVNVEFCALRIKCDGRLKLTDFHP